MTGEKIISQSTLDKLKSLSNTLREIVSECYPKTLTEESSFQKRFLAKAKENGFCITDEVGTPVLTTPKTKSISPLPEEFWKLDFVMRIDNAYIPIELKLRHKQQDIRKYPQDFIDDADKIRRLLINYDDVPEAFAICLTNLSEMVEGCDKKVKEYNDANKTNVDINWTAIPNTHYSIGIVDRVQKKERQPKEKCFVFKNNEKKKELE